MFKTPMRSESKVEEASFENLNLNSDQANLQRKLHKKKFAEIKKIILENELSYNSHKKDQRPAYESWTLTRN